MFLILVTFLEACKIVVSYPNWPFDPSIDAYLATQQETNANLVKLCLYLKILGSKVGVDISELVIFVGIGQMSREVTGRPSSLLRRLRYFLDRGVLFS